jgi:hypothetical protein
VLTVIQHQQCGAGTEGARDAGEHVGRDGKVTDRGAAGLTGAEDRRDLVDDVVVAGDTGERDEVHDTLLRLPAHRVRETGLAQTASTDDRRDAGRAQQMRHRGDVVVAAEEWVGLVGHTVPDHRRGTPQQLLMHGLECRAGVGAELVAQRAAVGLVPGQRRGRSHRRRLAAQQLH